MNLRPRNDLFRMAIKNVLRGRVRSILTITAVAIGVTAVLLLSAIGESGKHLITDELAGIGIGGLMVFSEDGGGLAINDLERISNRIEAVTAYMPFETDIGYYRIRATTSETAILIGVSPLAVSYMSLELRYGRMFTDNECKSGTSVCVVGVDFAQKEFKRENIVGRQIELTIGAHTDTYTIIGVADSGFSDLTSLLGIRIPPFIYLPYTAVGDTEDLQQVVLQVFSEADTSAVASQVKTILKKAGIGGNALQVENLSGYVTEFSEIADILTTVLAATAAISLLVAGVGIMNSMLATVTDRRCEIGVMKAIGAGALQIALIFLGEALILTFAGCVIGLTVAVVIALVVFLSHGILLIPGAAGIYWPLTITVLIGLGSGLMPAISAAKLQPIIAMRKE